MSGVVRRLYTREEVKEQLWSVRVTKLDAAEAEYNAKLVDLRAKMSQAGQEFRAIKQGIMDDYDSKIAALNKDK